MGRQEVGSHPDWAGTYAEQFERAAATWSHRLAVRSEAGQWSYGELEQRANRLAHYLQGLGVGPEVLVAVSLDRSLELAMTLLAIWKAGGAYLPLDPSYPAERLAYMLKDSGAALLLTQSQYLNRFSAPGVKVVCVDSPAEAKRWEESPATPPASGAEAEHLAYVIYTSGSTGRPKGVEITHRALLNHNQAIAREYALQPRDRVLQFASLSFDLSLEEICPTWLSGCALVLRPDSVMSSLANFLNFVARERISVLNIPTAYWHELVRHLAQNALPATVRLVVIGGERASEAAFRQWKQVAPVAVQLINSYGPTEATITATCYHADAAEAGLPIGRAIANTCTLLLDPERRPVPAGATGELYIGGAGLARGYRHQPGLTAERFVANPCPALVPAERLYKTGDLARCRADGHLEYVGRVDEQVKIRGFRIEPGEIEAALQAHPGIGQAVVVAREEAPGSKRLVAYYVGRTGAAPAAGELQEFLRSTLPGYMVPGAFVRLEALPLSPAGKVDRQRLPKPDELRPELEPDFLAARTATEQQLSAIWQTVLQLPHVGVKDNFFELGGDSLLGMQILGRVRETWQVELPLTTLFEGQTIEAMAAALEAGRAQAPTLPCLKATALSGPLPVSFVQERLYFLQQLHPESDAYHMPAAFRLRGHLDVGALTQALNLLVQRHEALRTAFQYREGTLVQTIAPALRMEVPLISLVQVPVRRRETELQRLLRDEARRPFDLSKAPLLRARLFRLQATDHALLIVMHHSISDGWSQGIFFQELESCYTALAAGSPLPTLPELPLQYRDYASWQRSHLQGDVLEWDLRYWKQHLAGAPAELTWPAAARPSAQGTPGAARASMMLPARRTRAAQALAQRERATPFMVLLTTLAITLHHWTGQKDLVMGTVVAGRSRREWEHLLGCFMNFLPLRLQLQGTETGLEVLRQVRQSVLAGQAHQECPFEQLVLALQPKRDGDRNPLYNVALLWHNYPTAGGTFRAGLQASPIALCPQRALLDLRFEAEPRGQEWCLTCEYDTSRFSASAIQRLLTSFSRCFERLLQEPEAALADFSGSSRWLTAWWRRWWSFWPILEWTEHLAAV